MIRKVLLITHYNQYESKNYFCFQLAKSLQKLGIEAQIYETDDNYFDGFNEIASLAPDVMLSYNTLFPNQEGKYLSDLLQIPYVQLLIDPALYLVQMCKSPLNHFTTVDRADCDWLTACGVRSPLFWPHAVEQNPPADCAADKTLDVVFLGTCIDFEVIRKAWQQRLNKDENSILENAIERVLMPNAPSLIEALTSSIADSTVDPKKMNLTGLFTLLDTYTRGKDRYEMIRAIKDVKVHVFGEPSWHNTVPEVSWKNLINDQKNIIFHPPVNYPESFEIAQKAKICLNSMPFFKHGSHERILNALAVDSVPLTTENGFVKEFFVPGEDLLGYSPGKWELINDQVNALIKNDPRRRAMAAAGKAKVMKYHTWDVRAEQLLAFLNERLS